MDIYTETKLITKKIIAYCKPEKVILFGSVVNEQAGKDSDIDLLVIKNSEKKRPYRVKEIYEALRGMERIHPLDPIVYTSKELKQRQDLGDYFILEVLKKGKVLYG